MDFTGEANVQHLIDTMRKRLCGQASSETREYAENLKIELRQMEPEISDVLVPNCVYRCGCPEMRQCGRWATFVNRCKTEYGFAPADLNIQQRYDLYNEMFYKQREE